MSVLYLSGEIGLLSAKPGCNATQRPADVYFAHDAAKLNAVDEAGSRVTVTSTAIDVKTVIPDLNRKVPDKGIVRSNDPPHPHDLPHLLNAENKAIDGQAYGGNLGGYLASIGIGFGAAAFDTVRVRVRVRLYQGLARYRRDKVSQKGTTTPFCTKLPHRRRSFRSSPPQPVPYHPSE